MNDTKRKAAPAKQSRMLNFAIIFVSLSAFAGTGTGVGAAPPSTAPNPPVVRVNNHVIGEREVATQLEALYPSNTVHGAIRPEKLKELRSRAVTELVVEELAYEQAVTEKMVVPMAEVKQEYIRLRTKYGANRFDTALKASEMSRQQYLQTLQRRMTLERHFQAKVFKPSRYTAVQVRSYYDKNKSRFQRPEQVHARLFLSATDPHPTPEDERKAREKAEMVLREVHAGKDFGLLTEQYSDDRYRVKGGDLGWVHKGRLEPEFEQVAFQLQAGQVSEVFRTSYGFNLMKVEERQPATQMKFAEVKDKLKTELETKKMNDLRSNLVASLRKGAQIEVLDPNVILWQAASPAPAMAAVAAH